MYSRGFPSSVNEPRPRGWLPAKHCINREEFRAGEFFSCRGTKIRFTAVHLRRRVSVNVVVFSDSIRTSSLDVRS